MASVGLGATVKHVLISVPLTPRDEAIWRCVASRTFALFRVLSRDSDRRDAALMLYARQMRADLAGRRIAIATIDWIQLGGESL